MLNEKGLTGSARDLSVTLCPKCMCMTYNIFDGKLSLKCGKCGFTKAKVK